MAKKKKAGRKTGRKKRSRAGRPATEDSNHKPEAEVQQEFDDAQRLGSGSDQLSRRLRDHHSRTPKLSGGDIDAAWDQADVGEETVGGSTPTPDQDVVDELGEAVGLTYEDNEELRTAEKLEKRDRHRWDLDPASADDYPERSKRKKEGP
jgi:Family of unknown function (DUF6335)